MKALESLGYMKPDHYKEYVIFNFLKTKYHRILKLIISAVYSLSAVALLIYGFSSKNKTVMWVSVALLVLGALFIYSINRNVKAICRSNAKLMRGVQHVKFGKNGFIFNLIFKKESENEHYEVTFEEIMKIYDAPKAFYVYINKRSVVIIPKEYLCCTISEAEKYLETYCPAEKLVKCV